MSNTASRAQADLAERGWRFYGLATRDRPERERRLRKEFDRLGIPISIHVAERPAEANGFASVGTWGCFLSHLTCLEKARADGATVAVIAEDDVVVTTAFPRYISGILDQLARRRWAMVYLGYLPQSPALREPVHLESENIGRLAGWEVTGAHLYAVHADVFDSLIDDFRSRLEPGGHRIAADGVLNEFRRDQGCDTLVCLPNLARQAPSPSGITPGSGAVQSVKTAVLSRRGGQAIAEAAKRTGWNLSSRLPARLHARAWNRRSGRQQAPAG